MFYILFDSALVFVSPISIGFCFETQNLFNCSYITKLLPNLILVWSFFSFPCHINWKNKKNTDTLDCYCWDFLRIESLGSLEPHVNHFSKVSLVPSLCMVSLRFSLDNLYVKCNHW